MQTLKSKNAILKHENHPDDIVTTLLEQRGISYKLATEDIWHDPRLLPDIHVACERIFTAQKNGERVMIFGDYDVDGISSTAALFLFLRDEMGIQASYRLPHRVRDGYGIKNYHMDEIASTGATLVITVDCGTKDIGPIEHARQLGLDVIVTDHHSCPEILPECIAVVNPRRSDSSYPFVALSGSGVVWKVIHALLLEGRKQEAEGRKNAPLPRGDQGGLYEEKILQKYVDIVSLGTIADCMPMLDENRTIVRRGLLQTKNSHHPFFQVFEKNLNRPIQTEEDIAFFVGPMLNAGGRITTPYQSLSTLLASSLEAYNRVQDLITVNETRKSKSRDAYERALEQVDVSAPFLFVIDEKLEHGILGLVAAKLTENFARPVGVFTHHNDQYIGSLRAPEGMNLVDILDHASNYILRYGGHAGAAGCTIEEMHLLSAQTAISQATVALYDVHEFTPSIQVDTVLDPAKIDLQLVQHIESLRPFGNGFPAPTFLLSNIHFPILPLGQTGEHIRWETGRRDFDIVWFRLAEFLPQIEWQHIHLIGQLKTRTWRDQMTVQFIVDDLILKKK